MGAATRHHNPPDRRSALSAWLARPLREHAEEIPLSGVMSLPIGESAEPVTILARAETGEEAAAEVRLIPVRGFFRRLFHVRY